MASGSTCSGTNPKRLLLIIDEFDKVMYLSARGARRQAEADRAPGPHEAFQPETLGAIRKVIMNSSQVSFAFSGLPSILHLEYKDRLFGTLDPVGLVPFREEECLEVIKSGEAVFTLSKAARDRVLRTVGGQPYLLQVLCAALFGRMIDEGRDRVALVDVDSVISKDLLPNEGFFTDYDALIGDDRQLLLGLALAHGDAPAGREYVSIPEMRRAMDRRDLAWNDDNILERLEHLAPESAAGDIDRPLVHRAPNDRQRFRLVVGLLGDHLIRQHGFDR